MVTLFLSIEAIYSIIIVLGIILIFLLVRLIKVRSTSKKLLTEHKEYKETLNSLDNKIIQNEKILEAIPDIIYIIDHKGFFNSAISKNNKLLFKPKAELIGSKIENVLPEDISELFSKTLESIARTKKTEKISFTYSVFNSEIYFIAWFIHYEDNKVLCVIRDRSEEEHKKQKLENKIHALKDSIKSKDRFFSIIAHDLKNPFNALIGFSSLLNEDFDEFSDEEVMEYIKQIHQSSEGLFSLLKNLLEWSKAKTGELEINPEKVKIHSIIENNIDILIPEARQKNISVEFKSGLDPDVKVIADTNMLTSIIRNLTANAIKFTYAGGQIIISTKLKNRFVECSVIDDGIGISEDDQKKLFRIDENLKKPGTQNEPGTGLGLLLCKEFVEQQGGKIYINSKPGEGSRFSFTVPIAS